MFALLALGSALVYGAADFIGGLTARRADTIAIVLISQTAGLLMASALVLADSTSRPGVGDWLWGGLAGLAGGVGVGLLYRALAVGVMAVVAPTTAVCAVIVPVVFALAFGERPALQESAGIMIAMLAVLLVSQQAPSATGPAGGGGEKQLGHRIGARRGRGDRIFFLALAKTTPGAGLWPLVAARVASVALFSVVAILIVARYAWRGTWCYS